LFGEAVLRNNTEQLAAHLGQQLGVSAPATVDFVPLASVHSGAYRDFFDVVTLSIAISSGMSVTEPRTGGAMPCGKSLPRNA
jgi:hypothetical protein